VEWTSLFFEHFMDAFLESKVGGIQIPLLPSIDAIIYTEAANLA